MRHHSVLLGFALLGLIWLVHAFGGNAAYDLHGTFGSSVQKLILLATWISIAIVAFNPFEHGKQQLTMPMAILKGAVILAGGLCLVN